MSDQLNRNVLQIDEGNTAFLSFLFLFFFVFNYPFIYLFYFIIIIFSYLLYDTRKEQDKKQNGEQDKTQEKRLHGKEPNPVQGKNKTRQEQNNEEIKIVSEKKTVTRAT